MVALLVSGYWAPSSAEDAWGGVRLFAADLSAANQTTVTKSDGRGLAKIEFDIPTMTISWEVSYTGFDVGADRDTSTRAGPAGDQCGGHH